MLGAGGFSRYKPGQRGVPARQLNAPLALLERLAGLRGGPGTVWTPAGPMIRAPGALFRIGTTKSYDDRGTGHPAYGIAGRLSGTDGLVGKDVAEASIVRSASDPYKATLQVWPSTYIGFNLSSQDVAPTTIIISVLMEGVWMTLWEDCPS